MSTKRKQSARQKTLREFLETPCPYCGGKVVEIDGGLISPYKAGIKMFACSNYPNCDTYVGSSRDTGLPLGSLANKELRALRIEAHKLFDTVWRNRMDRREAYRWLADRLIIEFEDCHIGNFREGNCIRTINECKKFLESIGRKAKK